MKYSKAFNKNKAFVSDKWASYLTNYDHLLGTKKSPKAILEVGIQNGGSLQVWKRIHPRAKVIVGVDIDQRVQKLDFKTDKIKIIVGDVRSPDVVAKIQAFGPFDLIVDDGSHQSADVIQTFVALWPILNNEGHYVIEDLHCSYWPSFQQHSKASITSMTFLKHLVDFQNVEAMLEQDRLSLTNELDKCGITHFDSFANVARVEFMASMCVIAKGDMSIGNRRISGTLTEVEANVGELNNTIFRIP